MEEWFVIWAEKEINLNPKKEFNRFTKEAIMAAQ